MPTLTLALPYVFEASDASPEIVREARLRISGELLLLGLEMLYPDKLPADKALLLADVVEALMDKRETVAIDEETAGFLRESFLGPEATARLRFAPQAASWLRLWLKHLHEVCG